MGQQIGLPRSPAIRGTNVLRLCARNCVGAFSRTNLSAFQFVVTNRLTVTTNGMGKITPNLNGRWLEIGRAYQMRATPLTTNWMFYKWEGDVDSFRPTLNFIMSSNLTISANFAANAFLARQGTYLGLFQAETPQPTNSGLFRISLTPTGTFSGKLMRAGATNVMSGYFDGSGRAIVVVPSNSGVPLVASWQLDMTNLTDTISGTINAGWTATATGNRAVYNSAKPAPMTGVFNLVIPGMAGSGPAGDSFGRATVGQWVPLLLLAGWLMAAA